MHIPFPRSALALALVVATACADDSPPASGAETPEATEAAAASSGEPDEADEAEAAPPTLQLEGAPRYGSQPLAPGFSPDPQELRGTARGELAASELGEDCSGFVAAEPLHVIEARGPFARLHLLAVGEARVGVALRTTDGVVHCTSPTRPSEDGEDSALVVTHLAPGSHRVWIVTAAADDPVRYVLGISELELTADQLGSP